MGSRRINAPRHREMGRARPIGPVFALAATAEGITPTREVPEWITGDDGVERVSKRHTLEKGHFGAEIIALGACGVTLANVNRDVSLSVTQRRLASYPPGGDIRFDNHGSPNADPEWWSGLENPGQILVVSGFVLRQLKPPFNFRAEVWDMAEPERHSSRTAPRPAAGLEIPPAML